MTQELVRYERDGDIAWLTLNRPERFNALNDALSHQLLTLWDELERDPEVRVAILKAEGPHFCAGADISPGEATMDGALPGLLQHRTYTGNGLHRFKPVIGLVQGYALGAGALLALRGCDIVLAAEGAQFGYPEARAGVALAPPEPLPYMPLKLSLEFMLLAWKGGRMMDACRAYALGLVNQVAPQADLPAQARIWADQLRLVPPLYIRAVKHGHYRAAASATLRAEEDFMNYVLPQAQSEDARESLAAFREKRAPTFKGR
jgi:crotonobetainyl-CoA hydratase